MELRPILSTLRRHKTASALIVLEIALSCAIICNALFLIASRLDRMQRPTGQAENELVRIQITGIGTDENATAQTRSDLAALRSLPGVTGATAINQVPFTNSSWNSGVRLSLEQTQASMSATVYMADEQFVQTLTLKLMTYGLGRPVEYQDMPTIRGIVRELKKDDYRFNSLITAIVTSDAFLKTAPAPVDPKNATVTAAR